MSTPSWASGRRVMLVGLALAALLSVPAPAAATTSTTYESYGLTGYEVWYAPTVGTFAGTGNGSGVALSAWYGSISHSGVISPTGTITGGWAVLHRLDGARLSGRFVGGTAWLLDDGPGCTSEAHLVRGLLEGVTRTDSAAIGSGYLEAILVHHRAWILGRCISYSASIDGTLSLIFEG